MVIFSEYLKLYSQSDSIPFKLDYRHNSWTIKNDLGKTIRGSNPQVINVDTPSQNLNIVDESHWNDMSLYWHEIDYQERNEDKWECRFSIDYNLSIDVPFLFKGLNKFILLQVSDFLVSSFPCLQSFISWDRNLGYNTYGKRAVEQMF